MSTPDSIYYWVLHLLAIVFWTVRIVGLAEKLLRHSKRASFTTVGAIAAALCMLIGFFWNNPPNNQMLIYAYTCFLWITPIVALSAAAKIKYRELKIASLSILIVLSAVSSYKLITTTATMLVSALESGKGTAHTCEMVEE